MISNKVFVVVEAVDNPKGAMLVRYSGVDRVEPDPEEKRLLSAEVDKHLSTMDDEIKEIFMAQIGAAKAMTGTSKVSYRVEPRMSICKTVEEVTAAILEAKEQNEEIIRLTKSGARFEYAPMHGLSSF